MKKVNYIFLLIILSLICVPAAYLLVIFLILGEIARKNYMTLQAVRYNKYLLIISIVCMISIVFSKYIQISSFFGVMIFVCILTCAYVSDNSENIDKEKLLMIIYITTLIVYLIGFIQMLAPSYVMPEKWVDASEYNLNRRMFATFFNPNVFGFYINIVIITVSANIGHINNKRLDIIGRIIFALSIVCLFLTFSRTGWISLLAALIIGGVLFDKKYIMYAMLILVCILGADNIFEINRSDISKLQGDGSILYRIELWKASIGIIKDNFITGIGFGTFFKYTSQYSATITKYIEHCHNIYLQIAMETGIVGLIAFGITIFCSVKRIVREYCNNRHNRFNSIVVLISLMLLIHGLVDSVSLTPQIMLILSILAGISIGEYKNTADSYEKTISGTQSSKLL